MSIRDEALAYHQQQPAGKVGTEIIKSAATKDDLTLAYSPGVAEPCKEIAKDTAKVYDYTWKGRTVAVVSDGTAVLGLGDIGPEAALPVMEGKAMLFKRFGDIDAVPLCINTKDTEEIITFVKNIAPTFGGINLEDISAPRCFEIVERLTQELDIPVFHDDQDGTATVVLAGLINACKVTERDLKASKVVINGAGAAGIAITKLLMEYGCTQIVMCDSQGIIVQGRENLNAYKQEIAKITNPDQQTGSLASALKEADIFIGVSVADVVSGAMIARMKPDPIIFAMANPNPEIHPDLAKKAGAAIVATGRSDYPNQVNNVLVFPGLFKGVLAARTKITRPMLFKAAEALAAMIETPTAENILPAALNDQVADVVAEAVKG